MRMDRFMAKEKTVGIKMGGTMCHLRRLEYVCRRKHQNQDEIFFK